jgi:hypothetical protein
MTTQTTQRFSRLPVCDSDVDKVVEEVRKSQEHIYRPFRVRRGLPPMDLGMPKKSRPTIDNETEGG